MNTFIKIRLLNVPHTLEQEVTLLAFDNGANGVSEALSFVQPDLTYDPSLVKARSHNLDIFFNERPGCAFFDSLIEVAPHIKWEITEEENKDWLSEWKKGFVPFKLVEDYWIVPSWLQKPAEAKVEIKIDPGMAFGTGTHATTKIAAYFVHKLLNKIQANENAHPTLQNIKLLDVGTGTAILAILAAKHGVQDITGIDIDPECIRVARENCILNEVNINIDPRELSEIKEQYDVVVANIIDGVLVKLKTDLLRVLKPNGHIFLTGILEEREQYFYDHFIENSGLTVVRRINSEEWVGYWCQLS